MKTTLTNTKTTLTGLSGLFMAAACLLILSGTAFGQANLVTVGDGDWFDTNNWTGGNLPSSTIGTTNVRINGNEITLSSGSATVYGGLQVNQGGGAGVLNVNGGTLKTFANPILGPDGTTASDSLVGNQNNGSGGILNLSDGAVIFQGDDTFVGNGLGAVGVINVSGGSLGLQGSNGDPMNSALLVIGQGGGLGSLNFTGGLIHQTNTAIQVGNQGNAASGEVGVFNVSGGTLTATGLASNIVVGARANALMTVSGGLLDVGDDLIVGQDTRYQGTGGTRLARVVITGGEVSGIDDVVMNAGNQTGFVDGVNPGVNLNVIDVEGGLLGGQNLLIGGGQNEPAAGVVNVMNVSGGLASFSAATEVGSAGSVNSSSNTLNVSGGVFHTNGQMIVGDTGGKGTINQTGGSIFSQGGLDLGQDVTVDGSNPSDGTVNISGGTYSSGNVTAVGENNTGSLNVSGNGVFLQNEDGGNNQRMIIGNQTGSVGTVTLSGNGAILNDFSGTGQQVYVGNLGDGTFIQTGGLFESQGTDLMTVGVGSGGNGTFLISGGTMRVAPILGGTLAMGVDNNTKATGVISGGLLSFNNIQVGAGVGTANTDVPQPDWVRTQAVLTIKDDADVTLNGDFVIGVNDDTIGTANIEGGFVQIGTGNNDDLLVASGGAAPTAGGADWSNGGAIGALNISGGTVNIYDSLNSAIGSFTSATINISGGTVRVGGGAAASAPGLLINSAAGGSSTINFAMSGGNLTTPSINITGATAGGGGNATNDFSGGVVRALDTSFANGTGTINLIAGATDALNITGSTFDLEGGGIADSAGNNNQILISGTGKVFNAQSIDADITMSGGEINMTEDNVGRSMSLENENLTATGGTLTFDLFAAGTNSGADFATNGGTNSGIYGITDLDIDAVTIQVLADNNIDPFAAGQRWDLLDLVGMGTFNVANINFALPTLGGGLFWDTSDFATNGQIAIAIPEPSRVLLIGLGSFLLLFPRRRRRS